MAGRVWQPGGAGPDAAAEARSLLERVVRICEAADALQLLTRTGQLLLDLFDCTDADHRELPGGVGRAAPGAWTCDGAHAGPRTTPPGHGEVHHLDLATSVRGDAVLGWRLTRSGRRFGRDDLARGLALLPLLLALDRLSDREARVTVIGRGAGGLTAREQSVLALVAQGLTATAVAHRLGVAPSTVRKHLEHAYAKLGRHDRLAAVFYAQTAGLLPGQQA